MDPLGGVTQRTYQPPPARLPAGETGVATAEDGISLSGAAPVESSRVPTGEPRGRLMGRLEHLTLVMVAGTLLFGLAGCASMQHHHGPQPDTRTPEQKMLQGVGRTGREIRDRSVEFGHGVKDFFTGAWGEVRKGFENK